MDVSGFFVAPARPARHRERRPPPARTPPRTGGPGRRCGRTESEGGDGHLPGRRDRRRGVPCRLRRPARGGCGTRARGRGAAAAVLREAGYATVRLLTNNPEKVRAVEASGIVVADREDLTVGITRANRPYLATKIARFGHVIQGV
ncbi:MAG: hypothetical protein ACLFPO_09250 [Spirochaetaceae bacterium]